jgi:lantibiotic modifying enzyme
VLPHGSPDLFNGSAGRLRAHLWLAQATGDSDALDAGLAAGRHLVSTADRPAAGRATWTVLPEFGGGQQLGYAHGAAGIADTLLDLAEYTGDDTFSDTALDAARWLIDQATPYDDGSVTFPSEFGGRNWSPLWCHGAAGIGRFLVHLHRSGHLADADQWLLGATGIAVARHGRTLGPVMCHGLAGSIDHLLDLHQIEPSGEHLREAWSLAGRLRDFHVEGNDGHLRALSDHPGVTTPDLTVGYAGIAALWLRLADPSKPTLLAGQPDAFWI